MNTRIILTILLFTILLFTASAIETTTIQFQKPNVQQKEINTPKKEENVIVEPAEQNKVSKYPVAPPKTQEKQDGKQMKRRERKHPVASIFEQFWNNNHWGIDSWFRDDEENEFNPPTNIYENEDSFTIVMELPGLERKDVNIKYERGDQDFLTISGEKKKSEHGTLVKGRIGFGKFEQKYQLKRIVDIKATFENGLLKIHLQRKPKEKPKIVDVKIE